jgi:HEXXH motif-containing protein
MGYMNSIAAAAAVRAGISVAVDVPVVCGRLGLPSVGQFEVADESVTHMVGLRVAGSAVFLNSGESAWQPLDKYPSFPVREHSSTAAGHSVRWIVDDLDPYRTFAEPERPRRLDRSEFSEWCGQLDDAWTILVAEHPDYAEEVSAVGPVIVPVAPRDGLVAASAASAFGGICLTPPASPAALAETVLHELQHSNLNALVDLVPLQHPESNPLCYAPWRSDPRPLSGLLHGIYAFAGVTEYWYRQWSARGDQSSPTAAFMFAHHREQVRTALARLGPAPELTETGARFLEVAAARLAACGEMAVPHELADIVALLSAEHRLAWQLRHLAVPEEHVEQLTGRWLAGEPAPHNVVVPALRADHRRDARSRLADLLRMRAVEPERLATDPGPAAPGEIELVRGSRAEASAAFADRVRADADDDAAGVGLLLATRAADLPVETVAATYRRIRTSSDAPPDPVSLVVWFADC